MPVGSALQGARGCYSCARDLAPRRHHTLPLGRTFRPRFVSQPLAEPLRSSTSSPGAALPAEPGQTGTAGTSTRGITSNSSTPAYAAERTELQTLIDSIPFTKLAIWGIFGLLVYQLHDFFGIVLGTFIVSFIGNSFVANASNTPFMRSVVQDDSLRRRVLVITFFLIILSVVTLFGLLTIPDIAREGADFMNRLQSDNIWVILVEKTRRGLGDQVMNSLEKAIYLATSNDLAAAAVQETGMWTAERSTQLGLALSTMLKGYTTTAAKYTGIFIKSVARFGLQALVSLILGFMFVWDMPRISSGVSTLKNSRLAPVYNEVAPMLQVFGQLFGKALEVQAQIALVNTALTALGMWVLAIPGMGLLSLFVFMCSFIPIMGCVISTVPIGFVALTEYGFMKLALVILMVLLVHFVEAYALNPAIYSAHLKLHPLMVLSVLLIAEHNLGVWGLMMAVPLTVFALDYCIKYPKSSVREVGQREVQKLSGRQAEAGSTSTALKPQAVPMLDPTATPLMQSS